MDPNVKNLLSNVIHAMIDLAEASGEEVRMTFQSVAMVVKPGRTAAELMEEFERNEKLAKLADELAPLLLDMFSVDEFRRFCRYIPNSNGIVDELPTSGSPKSIFAETALLLCIRGLVRTSTFWDSLERERGGRVRDIRPMRQRIMTELAGN